LAKGKDLIADLLAALAENVHEELGLFSLGFGADVLRKQRSELIELATFDFSDHNIFL